jgi:hypothetical protein
LVVIYFDDLEEETMGDEIEQFAAVCEIFPFSFSSEAFEKQFTLKHWPRSPEFLIAGVC